MYVHDGSCAATEPRILLKMSGDLLSKSDPPEALIAESVYQIAEAKAKSHWIRLFKLRPDLIYTDKDKELIDKNGKEWEDFLPFLQSNADVVVKPSRPGRKRKVNTFNIKLFECLKKRAGIPTDDKLAKEIAIYLGRSELWNEIKTAIKNWKDVNRRTEFVHLDTALKVLLRKCDNPTTRALANLIISKEEELKQRVISDDKLHALLQSNIRLKIDYLQRWCPSIGLFYSFHNSLLHDQSSGLEVCLGLTQGFPFRSDPMDVWIKVGKQIPNFSEAAFVDAWNCLLVELSKPLSTELGQPTWWYVV